MQLLYVKRTAVERSATEVLEKEIALGPELLEIERSENAGDRFRTGAADLIGPVAVARFAHLQSWREEATGRGMQIEPGSVQARNRRILRVQHGRVLAECRRRSGIGLGLGTILGSSGNTHAENQQRQPDCSHS